MVRLGVRFGSSWDQTEEWSEAWVRLGSGLGQAGVRLGPMLAQAWVGPGLSWTQAGFMLEAAG